MSDKRTALITGASGGLGRALAWLFSKNDYALILSGRDEADLYKTAVGCQAEAFIVQGDIRDESIRAKLAEVAERNDIDLLINSAGVYSMGNLGELVELDLWETMESNLIAPILLTRDIYRLFQNSGAGTIVNINSVAGKRGGPREMAYSASKFGLRGFMESLKHQAIEEYIRIIDVYLGALNTPMLAHRTDLASCIDPAEAAAVIFDATKDLGSLRVDEIHISRRKQH